MHVIIVHFTNMMQLFTATQKKAEDMNTGSKVNLAEVTRFTVLIDLIT